MSSSLIVPPPGVPVDGQLRWFIERMAMRASEQKEPRLRCFELLDITLEMNEDGSAPMPPEKGPIAGKVLLTRQFVARKFATDQTFEMVRQEAFATVFLLGGPRYFFLSVFVDGAEDQDRSTIGFVVEPMKLSPLRRTNRR